MSYSVKGTTLSVTRGDTLSVLITIHQPDGSEYRPSGKDTVRFAMKKKVTDSSPLLVKDIPISTMKLVLEPGDTKPLEFGNYVYDIQLTKEDGVVDTFITKSTLTITEEVD